MSATSTSTPGFVLLSLGFSVGSWLVTIVVRWNTLRHTKSPASFKTVLLQLTWPEGAAVAAFFACLIIGTVMFFLLRTICFDTQNLEAEKQRLLDTNKALSVELEWKKHNISTADAVFPNIIYLLQAFQIFRTAQAGKPCVLWFTATPDSMALASTLAQFSNSVSGCHTFGPFPPGHPDLDEDVMAGMIPGVIVLHAPRDNKAANQLEIHLGNQIQVRRSYGQPRTPKNLLYASEHNYEEDFIWLQFGTGVTWNSELFRAKTISAIEEKK